MVHTNIFNAEGRYEWVPLRKFWNEGDAKLYREMAKQLPKTHIKMLARNYDPNKEYVYDGRRSYVRQNFGEPL